MEMILLVGGPKDGETVEIRHGDTVRFVQNPRLDFSAPTVDPISFDEIIYCRSIADPRKFVFQP